MKERTGSKQTGDQGSDHTAEALDQVKTRVEHIQQINNKHLLYSTGS